MAPELVSVTLTNNPDRVRTDLFYNKNMEGATSDFMSFKPFETLSVITTENSRSLCGVFLIYPTALIGLICNYYYS